MQLLRLYARVLVGLLLALPTGAGAQERRSSHAPARPTPGGSGYAKLSLERVPARVPVTTAKAADVTQFLAVDRRGRVLVLRGDTLEVFRLGADESLHPLGKLACETSPAAYAAAMDPNGSTWLVSKTPFGVALCDFAEQQEPPGLVGWVSSLAFSYSGVPLVAVVPIGTGAPDAAGHVESRAANVFTLEDGRWKAVSWAPLPELHDASMGTLTQIKAHADALICAGPKDSIWLASWNAYRLQEVSASEKPKREIVAGSGQVEWVKLTEKERQAVAADVKKEGLEPGRNMAGPARPHGVIRAMISGRGGVIYLVVSTVDGLALDRFDPSQNVLERVLLDGPKVSPGPMTAALGTDELLIGGRYVAEGIWRISLDSLSEASWKRVKDVQINGKAAAP
jgi:hypothetical protein